MATKARIALNAPANDKVESSGFATVAPISKELIIGLVGYAGAGTSTAGERVALLLENAGYEVKKIKFSELIAELDGGDVRVPAQGLNQGKEKFGRATDYQDRGDRVRKKYGFFALSANAVKKIKILRNGAEPGAEKIAFVLASLKHPDEVELLRKVYDSTFRLVAVHCDLQGRLSRLCGSAISSAKYRGVEESKVLAFMDRDAKDRSNDGGQRVRDVFHLADFFLDNTQRSTDGVGMNGDIDRFISLLLGNGLIRPTAGEKAIYVAHASALQSACLSRQVGAVLVSQDGRIVATGKNDPPKFGGGTYDEDSRPDNRCFSWEFVEGDLKFSGCHNDRKKDQLYKSIADWAARELSSAIADHVYPVEDFMGSDISSEKRSEFLVKVEAAIRSCAGNFESMPGVKDVIEYSRSIHAEMAALMAASRGGISTTGGTLYVNVYPCHNCARHLVAAGVKAVFFIEPYVKSLALELHSDSLSDGANPRPGDGDRMLVKPFTGVGPRMYDDFFMKHGELKGPGGRYKPQQDGEPSYAVRLRELGDVEGAAIKLLPNI